MRRRQMLAELAAMKEQEALAEKGIEHLDE